MKFYMEFFTNSGILWTDGDVLWYIVNSGRTDGRTDLNYLLLVAEPKRTTEIIYIRKENIIFVLYYNELLSVT